MVPLAVLFVSVAAYFHFIALPRAIAETRQQFHMQVDSDVTAIARTLQPVASHANIAVLRETSGTFFDSKQSWREMVIRSANDDILVRHVRSQDTEKAIVMDVHKVDLVDPSSASSERNAGSIMVKADIGPSIAKINSSYRHFLLVLASALAFTLVLMATLLSSVVINPLRKVAAAADRLSKRDFRQPELAMTGDEVGDLARSVSHLSVALRQHEFDQRKSALTIAGLSYHDELTGLPNKGFLTDRLGTEIKYAGADDRSIALLFVDVDNFKSINDLAGHAVGDKCLREVAHRIVSTASGEKSLVCDIESMFDGLVDGRTFVARYSADVFAVLIAELEGVDLAAKVRAIQEFVQRPFVEAGREFDLSVSVGVSKFPDHGATSAELVKHADTALHAAKRDTMDHVRFFSDTLDSANFRRLSLESSLPRATENGEVVLHYQAKVDVRSGVISGVEALARWSHPLHGDVSPGEFIPISERQGSIIELGQWVVESACAQAIAWQRSGLPSIRMAVNLSPRQFSDSQLVDRIRRAVEVHDMDPSLLELELTEGALVDDPERAERTLTELKELGVYLSVDDFGTGYSSLSYLHRYPIDAVKIDRSFINTITEDENSRAIVSAIISMARSLNMTVVAEGVETPEQLKFLASAGCDDAQGFYLSRPIDPSDFEKSFEDTVNWTLSAVKEITENADVVYAS